MNSNRYLYVYIETEIEIINRQMIDGGIDRGVLIYQKESLILIFKIILS